MKDLALTPQQRIEAYQSCIKYIKEASTGNYIYVCILLKSWLLSSYELVIVPRGEELLKMFPEFLAQKPENKIIGTSWWTVTDHITKCKRPRIKALERSIELVLSQHNI